MRAGFCLLRPRLGAELCPPGAAAPGIRVPFRVSFPDCCVTGHPKGCGPSSVGDRAPAGPLGPLGSPESPRWPQPLGCGYWAGAPCCPSVGGLQWAAGISGIQEGEGGAAAPLRCGQGVGGRAPPRGAGGRGEGRRTPPRAAGGRGRAPEPEFADAGNWWPCLAVAEYASLGFFRLLAYKGRGLGLKFSSLYIESGTSR